MKFYPLDKTGQEALAPYFAAQRLHIGDFSLAFCFMWYDSLHIEYAFAENCLILRELYAGKYYFHYPLSLTGDAEEERAAIRAVEAHCRDGERLHFTNVPASRLGALAGRYGEALITDNRRWRDYLYRAEDFIAYPGKKFAGQRNHVHKFGKLYPDWTFERVGSADEGRIADFLHEYEGIQRRKNTYLAEEEMGEVYALLPHLDRFGLFAGVLTAGGKIVGFSAGERCGDMVVVHVEKALREYEGAYPFLAQQFARAFCGEGVEYLNRMDDAGDAGLRKSKLQYNPCELVSKFNVTPKRAIDVLSALPAVRSERLVLSPVRDADAEEYARLACDPVRNRYWGYDWRSDRKSARKPSAKWFLRCAREDFHEKREMPLGIYAEGRLAGEVTLHRFGYGAEAEIGVRLLPEAEGKGYAREAVRAYTDFAFLKLNLERVEAKCFRENERSRATLLGAGMRPDGEDSTYFYFSRTPET